MNEYQDIINKLQKEIMILKQDKEQFNEKMNFLDEIHEKYQESTKKNFELIKENRKLNENNEELLKKLELSINNSKEKEFNFDKDYQEKFDKYNIEINELKKLLSNEKKEFMDSINQKELTIKTLQNNLKEKNEIVTKCQNSNNKLITLINSHFQKDFKNDLEIENYFLNLLESTETNISDISSINNDTQKLKNKIHKQKNIIKNLQKFNSEFKLKNLSMEQKYFEINHKIEQNLSDFNHEKELIELNHLKEKENLNHKIKLLENQITVFESKINNQNNKQIEKNNNLSNENNFKGVLSNLDLKLEKKNEIIDEQNKKIENINKEYNGLIFKYNCLKEKYNRMETDFQNINQNNKLIETSFNRLSIEKITLENNLSLIKVNENIFKEEINKLKHDLQEKDHIIKNFEKSNLINLELINSYKEDLNNHFLERNKLINFIINQNQILGILENTSKLQINYENEIPKETLIKYDTIPNSSWFNSDFPKELCKEISIFAEDNSLSQSIKLKRIFHIISKFYNEEKEKNVNLNRTNNINLENNFKILFNFIKDLFDLLKIEHITENISDSNKLLESLNLISNLIKNNDHLSLKNNQLLSEFNILYKLLNVNSFENASIYIKTLIENINKYETILEKLNEKLKKEKKYKNKLENKYLILNEEFETIKLNFNKSQQIYKKEKNLLSEELHKLKKKNIEYEHKLNEFDFDKEINKKINQENLDNIIQDFNNKYQNELKIKENIIEEKNFIINENININNKLQNNIIELKKFNEELKIQNSELIFQISNFEKKLNDEKNMNIPINNNQEILDNFKIIINEIQNKNLELSNLIESLNKQILEKDIIINDLNKLNQEFKNQLNEFKLKRDLLEDEILKEKKLIETKIKTSNLTLEIQYQNKIEEILTLNEKDKKKFYNLIKNNFYQYYYPSL